MSEHIIKVNFIYIQTFFTLPMIAIFQPFILFLLSVIIFLFVLLTVAFLILSDALFH